MRITLKSFNTKNKSNQNANLILNVLQASILAGSVTVCYISWISCMHASDGLSVNVSLLCECLKDIAFQVSFGDSYLCVLQQDFFLFFIELAFHWCQFVGLSQICMSHTECSHLKHSLRLFCQDSDHYFANSKKFKSSED